ncbi:putative membrane protein [Nymphaea thermarum]|nr:putative membrane protein [Nymphaea thermarum]
MESILQSSGFSSSSSAVRAPARSLDSPLGNLPLVLAFVAFAVAQTIKFLYSWYRERRFDAKKLIASGGMPSAHSAAVTALAVSIGLQDGFDGSLFAVAAVMASIVMHDAFGVRLHAGRQAEVLNQIVYELPEEHPLSESRPLRELIGHTPLQVIAGAVLGIFTAFVAYAISKATISNA